MRHEAILNGTALSTLHPSIYILDISYPPPAIRTESFSVAKRDGARIRRQYIEKNTVTIQMMVRAYDVKQRQQICGEIARWARAGGILETNDRPGQQLRCICETAPTIASALKWTDPVTVTFSAYEKPFWEEKIQSALTLTGANASGSLYVPGDAGITFIEATITANAPLASVTIQAGEDALTLSGLSIASGGSIIISYSDDMIQSIKTGTTSLLNKRTGADDLRAACGGTTAVSISASASVTAQLKARGLWI